MTLFEASLKLTESEYRNLPELSYSTLSRYDREGYECLRNLDEPISSPSLLFGSMLDCLLTQGEDAFFATYVVCNTPPMSESLKAAATLLLAREELQMALIPDDAILDAANIVGFCPSYKDVTRVTKIREGASEYYNFMKTHQDCVMVSEDMMSDVQECALTLKTHPRTREFFIPASPVSNHELFFQLQFKSKFYDLPYKGMLDLVKIDHHTKTIYPCDIKTTKSIYTFVESFYTYRYYLQAAMYTCLLKDTIAAHCPELQDYTIAPYQFIVIDRTNKIPVVFKWAPTSDVVTPGGYVRKSWTELLTEVASHIGCLDQGLPSDWLEQIAMEGSINLNKVNDENQSKIIQRS